MKRTTTIYAGITIATILVASVIAYPFAQTAIAALHEDDDTNGDATTMGNTTDGNIFGTTNNTGIAENNATTGARVEVAAGSNATVQYYTFTPQTVEINAGESVTWTSPSELAEIHTVTFVLDQNLTSDLILPFALPEQATATDFELLPPFNAGEPVIIQTPEGKDAIVALNKYVFYPAVVDANGEASFLNGTDLEYTLEGTEKAINSGIIVPPFPPTTVAQEHENRTAIGAAEIPPPSEGVTNDTSSATAQTSEAPPSEGPPFPPVSSFSVTFEESGTYPYFCAIHPWMSGQVVVRGENSTDTSATAITP